MFLTHLTRVVVMSFSKSHVKHHLEQFSSCSSANPLEVNDVVSGAGNDDLAYELHWVSGDLAKGGFNQRN